VVGHGQKLGRKQEAAIAALLSQRTVEDAARVAGIGARTLFRWLELAEFREAYLQARRQAFGQASARLQQATGAAVSVLLTLMLDANAPGASRVRAAHSVLDLAAKALELDDIEVRLRHLEEAQNTEKLTSADRENAA
jgi:transposase-like protein